MKLRNLIYLISFAALVSTAVFAGDLLPVMTRPTGKATPQQLKAIDQRWSELHKQDAVGGKELEQNPQQCAVFRSYIHDLLKKIISSSHLETQTQDLYFSVNCGNSNQFPLGAKVLSRTLIMQEGYFGSLKSEDEFVALLSHELSHHILRHEDSTEPMIEKLPKAQASDLFSSASPSTSNKALLEYIRNTEREADANSLPLLANAGYSYTGALDLLQTIATLPFRSNDDTHDSPEQRLQLIQSQAQKLGLKPTAVTPLPPAIQAAIAAYFSKEVFAERTVWREKVW